MKRFIYTLSIITLTQFAEVNSHEYATLLPEEREINKWAEQGKDLVVFHNGSQMYGKIKGVPPLEYSFGTVPFRVDEIALIDFGSHHKVHYITRDGQNFVADLPQDKFIFFPKGKSDPLQLDPSHVSYVLLENRGLSYSTDGKLFDVQLKNGDHVPVYLETTIRLSNGWNEYTIKADAMNELNFNGGFYGYVKSKKSVKPLQFAFVVDKYLDAHLVKNQQSIKLPWGVIENVRGLSEANKKDSAITHDPEYELSIGYDYQNPLRGSLGAIAIPPSVFDHLDNEELYLTENKDVNTLFKINQELESLQEIAFENSKKIKLSAEDVTFLTDAMLAADTKKESVPGESFDYKELKDWEEDDEDLPKEKSSQIDFSMLNLIQMNDDIAYVTDPLAEHSRLMGLETSLPGQKYRNGMVFIDEETISLGAPTKTNRVIADSNGLAVTLLPTVGTPALITKLPGFYIDSHLVSNTDYALFLSHTKHPAPAHWKDGNIPHLEEKRPVVNISYQDALDYASWKGMRLPSQEEVLRAHRHGALSTYSLTGIFEWTSTSPDRPGPTQFHQIAVEVCEHGKPCLKKMPWHQFNEQTGFRCVADEN